MTGGKLIVLLILSAVLTWAVWNFLGTIGAFLGWGILILVLGAIIYAIVTSGSDYNRIRRR